MPTFYSRINREGSNSGSQHNPDDNMKLNTSQFPSFDPGQVWLVGAGPGAPGLLTLLGYYALQKAEVVIYDALVNKEILNWANPKASIIYAGKRGGKPSPKQEDITFRLIEYAQQNYRVLRLKGGDPFVFGRGGEECQKLVSAGIQFRIVPGISAGIGGLAYAGIPVTHRDTNQSILFLTGHEADERMPTSLNWSAVAQSSPVIVLYMALKNLPAITRRLIQHGRDPEDKLVIVSNATLRDQQVYETTLASAVQDIEKQQIQPPAIIVIGPVADFRNSLDWYAEILRENSIG